MGDIVGRSADAWIRVADLCGASEEHAREAGYHLTTVRQLARSVAEIHCKALDSRNGIVNISPADVKVIDSIIQNPSYKVPHWKPGLDDGEWKVGLASRTDVRVSSSILASLYENWSLWITDVEKLQKLVQSGNPESYEPTTGSDIQQRHAEQDIANHISLVNKQRAILIDMHGENTIAALLPSDSRELKGDAHDQTIQPASQIHPLASATRLQQNNESVARDKPYQQLLDANVGTISAKVRQAKHYTLPANPISQGNPNSPAKPNPKAHANPKTAAKFHPMAKNRGTIMSQSKNNQVQTSPKSSGHTNVEPKRAKSPERQRSDKSYGSLPREEQVRIAATKFYEQLWPNEDLMRRCEDVEILRSVYMKWKQTAIVPDSSKGTKFRGSFYDARKCLVQRNVIKRSNNKASCVVVWTKFGTTCVSASQRVKEQREKIESGKGGIVISKIEWPTVLAPKRRHHVFVTIENTSDAERRLVAIVFLNTTNKTHFQFEGCTFPCKLAPGAAVKLTLAYMPTHAGVERTLIEFEFEFEGEKTLSIGRYVTVESGESTLHEQLKPTAPYKRKIVLPKNFKRHQKHHKDASHGIKPAGATAVSWVRNCDDHNVPDVFDDSMDVWADQLRGTGLLSNAGPKISMSDYRLLQKNLLWMVRLNSPRPSVDIRLCVLFVRSLTASNFSSPLCSPSALQRRH